jgi:ribose 5-phosphate isomerase RpiB
MIIAIGNDHAGVEVKERIQQHLVNKGTSGYQQRI